ncbi:energy transducer TonB [Sphingomonas sp. PB2P19]|uniref:energy transducer TonB family protein n=1 Tax=Sphingomonas rhamnosi TaxID=3096156 RepID=UPI002FC58A01
MKSILVKLATAVAVLFPVAPAVSQTPIDNWVKQVSNKLDANIEMPTGSADGLVTATFKRSETGQVTDVIIDSRDSKLTRAALATMRRLRDLPPLPAGFEGKRIRMNLLIGNMSDYAGYVRQLKALRAQASSSNTQLAKRLSPVQVALLGPH